MGYWGTLAFDWTTRDRLAVVLVAVTVAFLTGTTLLVVGVGSQTTAMAGEYGSDASVRYYDGPGAAERAAADDAVVFPVATVVDADGAERTVVGVPPGAVDALPAGLGVQAPPERGVSSPLVADAHETRLDGRRGSVTVDARPAPDGLLSPTWYRATPALVDRLGATGAVVVTPSTGGPAGGTPVRAVLAFFAAGVAQLRSAVLLVEAGAAVLAAVSVYSVTRASVDDRRETLGVLRATGVSPRRLLALFAVRAGALALAGVALGYALGVVVTNAVVNAGVFLGVPTSLSMRVTGDAVRLLLPGYAGVVAVGASAGALAVRQATRGEPARLLAAGTPTHGVGLRLLDWRAVVPTAATLAVFVVCTLLVWSAAAAGAPLLVSEGTTVTESGAVHPVASRVPQGYAGAFESAGVNASPEILAFSVVNGTPFLTRGADYPSFAAVSDARLVGGERPDAPNEAVVGADLARTLGVGPGSSLTLGGSTHAAATRVTVVGTFEAPGALDDQLVVSLAVARHLAKMPAGDVQFVRTDETPAAGAGGVVVAETDVPGRVVGTGTVTVDLTLVNLDATERTRRVALELAGERTTTRVTLGPGERTTRTVSLPVRTTGVHELRVGDEAREVRVVSPSSLVLSGLPSVVPPDASPRVTVRRADGTPVENATVRVGDATVRTDARGRASVPFASEGTTTVVVTAGDRRATRTVDVRRGAPRRLPTRLVVSPAAPTVVDRSTATLTLRNPWDDAVTRTVTLAGAGRTVTRTVTVPPDATASVSLSLGPLSPGEHAVSARVDGADREETTVDVSGEPRLASALATRGASGSTGVGRAMQTAFGNLQVFVAALVVLAGAMCAGGVATAFSQAVRRRRHAIGVHRATGSSRARVARLVLGDGLRVGAVATVVAVAVGVGASEALAATGWLTFYGIRVTPTLTPFAAVTVVVGSLGLVVAGASTATLALLVESPTRLLTWRDAGPARGGEEGVR